MNPTILFNAVAAKDVDTARKLLMADGEVNIQNTNGSSLCHVAVRTGDSKVLELVLAFHPDVNVKESASVGGCTPLHAAAAVGSGRMVRQLLQAHADPLIQDGGGNTPLHICARKGHADIAKTLLNETKDHRGAAGEGYADIMDGQGKTAWYWAKEFGCTEVADLLPVKPYDPLEQLELKKKTQPVWDPEWKKKAKKKREAEAKGKGKGGKDAAKKKKK